MVLVCANVTNLLLVRANARRREFAVCAAIGASRPRLGRELFVENLTLGGTGGARGAHGRGRSARVRGAPDRAVYGCRGHRNDGRPRVLMFATPVSLACGVLFGPLPAWQGARTNVQGVLRSDVQTAMAGRRRLVLATVHGRVRGHPRRRAVRRRWPPGA